MNKVIFARNSRKKNFSYVHKYTDHPKSVDFEMHTHKDYEIFIFLKGSIDFLIENKSYTLHPYDIILIHESEPHRILPNPDKEYERVVISISDDFFREWKCESMTEIFHAGMEKRFIPAETILINDIDKQIFNIEKYINETSKKDDTVVKCAIIELLHAIRFLTEKTEPISQNKTVSAIISYINDNISKPLSLDMLAEKFFLSKYYMCRIFKKNTGVTINKYITTRRIILTKKLCKSGASLSSASADAGFGCYANFYKAYVKEFGQAPKKGLKGLIDYTS